MYDVNGCQYSSMSCGPQGDPICLRDSLLKGTHFLRRSWVTQRATPRWVRNCVELAFDCWVEGTKRQIFEVRLTEEKSHG